MNIVIFGPQGSGKGTQAELIARRHGLAYISTGDIFRYHIQNKTTLGQEIQSVINSGSLVSDDLTNEVVKDRIHQPDCTKGFVLDGYPRNQNQLEYLNGITKFDYAIVIDLSDEEAIKRLGGRLACECGLSYHVDSNPPNETDICNKCGNKLFRRDDDQPEAIKKRLDIYHQKTEPLFDFYKDQGILNKVDGSLPIEDVYHLIEDVITNNGTSHDHN